MKKLSLLCGVFLFPFISLAQNEQKEKNVIVKLDSIVVQAVRAGKNTPVAWSYLSGKQINSSSPSGSIPMMLSNLPSVVSTTEGGNGLGYSYMRVRGSDGSRINVTLNGIALNDSESQEMFWVDLPALTSFIQNAQLQRGIGTSVNGSGAFGASLNMQTLSINSDAYGSGEFSYGSWNTVTTTLGAGSGLLENGSSFDIRYSNNHGNGYVRNSGGDLNSLYIRAGYTKRKDNVAINFLYGDQKTGIAWNGTPGYMLTSNRRYNPAGEYFDEAGNVRYYDNETDNYKQMHLQGAWQHQFSDRLFTSFTLNYTNGFGYYENYKYNRKFSKYGFPNQTVNGVNYSKSDFIIRQILDNDYYAANFSLNYITEDCRSTTGIFYSTFDGRHFGKVLWSKYNESIQQKYRWYDNRGDKSDFTVFSKLEKRLVGNLYSYLDLQYRRVTYRLRGPDDDLTSLDYYSFYNFFNPRAGVLIKGKNGGTAYFSVAVGHKEPTRSDLKDAIKSSGGNSMKSEKLVDYEAGYRYESERFSGSLNLYFMEYKDQLVPTGKLSETGYVIKENVPDSYRRGVEAEIAWRICKNIAFEGNATLSRNKIKNFTLWTELYDNPDDWNYIGQRSVKYSSTNISYSPEIIAYSALKFENGSGYLFSVNSKFVGKQYYDNSSNDDFSIPAYLTFNLSAGRELKFKNGTSAGISLFVNNIFNREYFSNAWVYRAQFESGAEDYIEDGLFPQPGTNFTIKVNFKF